MKLNKIVLTSLMILLSLASSNSWARDHGGGHHGGHHGGHGSLNFGFYAAYPYGYPFYGSPYYTRPYYDYPYYNPPAVIAVQPPPPVTYIEQAPQPTVQENPSGYWYYCTNPEGYFPYVRECSSGWQQVDPVPPSSR
jgi:hypothetical protein